MTDKRVGTSMSPSNREFLTYCANGLADEAAVLEADVLAILGPIEGELREIDGALRDTRAVIARHDRRAGK